MSDAVYFELRDPLMPVGRLGISYRVLEVLYVPSGRNDDHYYLYLVKNPRGKKFILRVRLIDERIDPEELEQLGEELLEELLLRKQWEQEGVGNHPHCYGGFAFSVSQHRRHPVPGGRFSGPAVLFEFRLYLTQPEIDWIPSERELTSSDEEAMSTSSESSSSENDE